MASLKQKAEPRRPMLFTASEDDDDRMDSFSSSIYGSKMFNKGNISRTGHTSFSSQHGQSGISFAESEASLDKATRRKMNYDKSLQLLAEQESLSLFLGGSHGIMKEAGTPLPLLKKDKSLMESSLLDKGNSFYEDTDQSLNVSFRSESLGTPYKGKKSTKQLERSILKKAEDHGNLSLVIESDPVMQGTKGLFSAFMESVNSHSKASDAFELVGSFEEILREEIEMLVLFLKKTDPTRKRFQKTAKMLELLYQECYTWRLIVSLFSDRLQSESMDITFEPTERMDRFKSEKDIVDAFYERDTVVRQCQLIVDWLEKNAEDDLEELNATANVQFGSDSVSWEHTIAELQLIDQRNKDKDLLLSLVTEIDPDAPIRQRRKLADLDEQDELRLLRHVFACIRAGQLQKAQEICCKYGQSWRAATLDGWRLWNDANYIKEPETGELVATEGNPCRDIWKAACWAILEEEGMGVYEKAIYAALCGNLKHLAVALSHHAKTQNFKLLPVCNSWEDIVWAYFKVMVDTQVEQELSQHSRTDRRNEDMPSAYWEETQSLTPEYIFSEVKAHPKEVLRRQSEEPFHVFQKLLVLNEIDDLFLEMDKVVRTENFCKPHLVRFMAHLALFFQNVGIQVQDIVCSNVIRAYIEILISSQQTELIACYTSKLPVAQQVEVYSSFLEQIQDINDRKMCLQLAEEAGLDTAAITKTVVENIRTKEMHIDDEDKAETDMTSEADKKQIEAIQWLVFDPSLRAEALKQANAIIRCFLATSKVNASRQVFEKLPEDSIDVVYKEWQKTAGECPLPDDDENAVNEYLCTKAYLDAHAAFNDWHHHYNSLTPVKPIEEKWRSFTERVEFEQKMNDYELHRQRWQRNLAIHVEYETRLISPKVFYLWCLGAIHKETKDRLYNVLLYPEGWMVDKVETSTVSADHSARAQQLLLLRQICLPLVCSMLQAVLKSNGQHKEFLQLADVIQSETNRLYEVFQRDQLQRMLILFKDSAMSLLAVDKDAFGYDKLS